MNDKFDKNADGEMNEERMLSDNLNGSGDIQNRLENNSLTENKPEENQVAENSMAENGRSDKKVKRHAGIYIYAFFVTLALGAAVAAGGYFYHESKDVDEKTVDVKVEYGNPSGNDEKSDEEDDSQIKDTIREYMESGKGTMAMLRELFPENVVVFDTNKYLFLPVYDNVNKNDINNADIKQLENGELVYMEGDKQISHKGIDVSKFQGQIDWNTVAASGVEFAIIRLGYRGYGTGAIVMDETAIQNIEGALGAGIKVGVYFFSQAITIEEAVEEAEFVIDKIKAYDITYPVIYDTEEIVNDNSRAEGLSKEERTEIAIAFLERVKKAGYTPVIYANLRWFTMYLDIPKLEAYDKWYAYYDKELYFPYRISMWQYTESGQVAGIEGSVDLNISFKDWE